MSSEAVIETQSLTKRYDRAVGLSCPAIRARRRITGAGEEIYYPVIIPREESQLWHLLRR